MTGTTIGQRIRAARRGNNMTQVQLADRADLHEMTISRIEVGVYRPSVVSVVAIAKALGVPVGQLLDEEADDHVAGKGAA